MMLRTRRWWWVLCFTVATACGPAGEPSRSVHSRASDSLEEAPVDAADDGQPQDEAPEDPGEDIAGDAPAPKSASEIPSTGPLPDGCVRIEGASLGDAGLTLEVGEHEATFTRWRPKDGERGEYVGFNLRVTGRIGYAVKAGGETYFGTSERWLHPAGTCGPEAPAISNVTLCPLPDSRGGADCDAPAGDGSGGDELG